MELPPAPPATSYTLLSLRNATLAREDLPILSEVTLALHPKIAAVSTVTRCALNDAVAVSVNKGTEKKNGAGHRPAIDASQ